ncbi:hypothetical protein [Vibrio diabolicus]|uniref:hypothetical protein n=1 Tax=Vibrio diabolicus TaxID=50719 RepID=UPI00193B64C7|nr:hypothetical protein [Vibrio diabolicus]
MKLTITTEGVITTKVFHESEFDDELGAPRDHYREGCVSDSLTMLTLVDEVGCSLGFCCFYIDYTNDYRDPNLTYVVFGIHYIFIRDRYRGLRLTVPFTDYIMKQIMLNPNFTHYVDASLYQLVSASIGSRITDKLDECGKSRLP